MPDSELYVGLAGVAVVFAGFAGISAALAGRQPEQWRYIDSARLSAMIESSIVTALFSLLPLLVARFTSSQEVLWQLCSIPFFLHAAFAPVRTARVVRRAYKSPDTDRDSPINIALWLTGMALAIAVLLSNAFALAVDFMEGFYFLALLIYLGISARMFVRTLTVLRNGGPR